MKNILISIIKFYQKIPLSSHNYCKYNPTCSQYMIDAITNYGTLKGCIMGTKRILRCNPISKGGYDPVPIKENNNEK